MNDEYLLEYNKDLSSFTTLKLRAKGNLATVNSISGLESFLKWAKNQKIETRIIGLGSNLVLPTTGKENFFFIKLNFENYQDNFFEAGFPLRKLTSMAIKNHYKDWDSFTGVPGSLGGAIVMNAGTGLGEIGSIVSEVFIIDKKGNKKVYEITESKDFSYRNNHFLSEGEIIYGAKLRKEKDPKKLVGQRIKNYLQKRLKSQPLDKRTCGSVFKNIKDGSGQTIFYAGKTIEQLGLKGHCVGNLRVSPKHANFIENMGEGTREDFLTLIEFILKKIDDQFNVKFELEVKIL